MPYRPSPSLLTRLPLLAALLSLLLVVGCGDAEPDGAPLAAPAEATGAAAGPSGAEAPDTVDVRRLGHAEGAADAPVTVIEFSDFGCPYCAQFATHTYPELHRDFIQSGQVRWQFVPFVLGIFPNGAEAALAAECAAEQGRFWAMHHRLYEQQAAWKRTDDPAALFLGLAADVGLDEAQFARCYAGADAAARIQHNTAVAQRLGIRATPSFLVNGTPIEGALPAEQFRRVLEWAGASAPAPVGGTTAPMPGR